MSASMSNCNHKPPTTCQPTLFKHSTSFAKPKSSLGNLINIWNLEKQFLKVVVWIDLQGCSKIERTPMRTFIVQAAHLREITLTHKKLSFCQVNEWNFWAICRLYLHLSIDKQGYSTKPSGHKWESLHLTLAWNYDTHQLMHSWRCSTSKFVPHF